MHAVILIPRVSSIQDSKIEDSLIELLILPFFE
jgi:hypothetical protein